MQAIEMICAFIAAAVFVGVVATSYLLARINEGITRIASACEEDSGICDADEVPAPKRRSSLQVGIRKHN